MSISVLSKLFLDVTKTEVCFSRSSLSMAFRVALRFVDENVYLAPIPGDGDRLYNF